MEPSARIALLLGSTGLVGGLCLRQLLDSGVYAKVIAVTRAKLPLAHSHLENIISDFSPASLEALMSGIHADDVFCCLGTTLKKAGSKAAFEQVDYSIPMILARLAKKTGTKQFLLVSALGANPDSALFYSRVKGRLERDLIALNFDRTLILQPSLLDGDREEFRLAESLSVIAYRCIKPLIGSHFSRIQPVKADCVARCLVAEAIKPVTSDRSVIRITSDLIGQY